MIIDTSPIDAFRQGVELRTQKHFTSGIVKIHSGEKDHILKRNSAGQDNDYEFNFSFNDAQRLDPVTFLTLSKTEKIVTNVTIDYVVGYGYAGYGLGAYGTSENEPYTITTTNFVNKLPIVFDPHYYMMNGIIEPLSIRVKDNDITRTTSDLHEIRGEVILNEVKTVYELDDSLAIDEMLMSPFSDVSMNENDVSALTDETIKSLLNNEFPSTEQYIRKKERSSTSGWTFDSNIVIGTDSIAFGGMGH